MFTTPATTRREFVLHVAATAAGLGWLHTAVDDAMASPPPAGSQEWSNKVGFALFTVRAALARDADAVMAEIASMGIREVQPRTYLDRSHKEFRALLDRHGLTCHSTHEFSIPGPGLERELESLASIGIGYVRFPLPDAPDSDSGGVTGRGGRQLNAPPANSGRGRGGGADMVETPEMMKRTAEYLNRNGAIARRFGMKALYHNHTTEFQRYPGESLLPYEVLLAESDPDLVAMEIDLGWAAVAGHDILKMFQAHPGRFELWHVKDAFGLRHLTPAMNQLERRANVMLTPVGLGEVDYKSYFEHAGTAGLKHFYIEQDNADAWGDALAATRVSIRNLKALLG